MRIPQNKKVFYTIVFASVVLSIISVVSAQKTETSCDCANLLDETISKIELDYAAYHIEIKGKRETEYQTRANKFKKRAAETPLDKCVPLLQEFITFFRDGHLFIGQNPKLTDEQVAELQKKAEKVEKSEAELKDYFTRNAARIDPLEGFWYAGDGSRLAIFRDNKTKNRDFVAVLLSENVELWERGQVKAEFTKLKDGSYDVVYYNEKHFPLHINVYERGKTGGARIRRDLILHMAPNTWGKVFPAGRDPLNKLDPTNPRMPVLQVIDSENVLISIPSHIPNYAPVLKELVETHKTQIENAENLIIDLRGNEGGSAGMTNVLMPYIETESKRPSKYWVGDETFVLSSETNIKIFKRFESQGWLPKNLFKRLEENPGKMIPFADPGTKNEESPEKVKESEKPKNVAILSDGAVVSAGEAFILRAMRNKKVTLFGQPTAGVIDYQTTAISGYKTCPDSGIYLGYPLFAASGRLPAGGVNKTGITPDVPIGKDEKDPVRFIINYYKNRTL